MARKSTSRPSSARPPGAIRMKEAAERIGCNYETVRAYVAAGVFTAKRPLGKGGRGAKPVWLSEAEIEAFRSGGTEAVFALRGK